MFQHHLKNLKRLRRGLNLLNIEPVHLFFPSLLGFFAALAEGAALGLLIPTLRGLVYWDFKPLYEVSVLKMVLEGPLSGLFESSQAIFILMIFLIYFSVLLKNYLSYESAVLTSQQVRKLAAELRRIMFGCYMQFNKAFFDQNNSGHLHQVIVGYTEQIALQLRLVSGAAFGVFSLAVYFAIMCAISWELTLFMICVAPCITFIFQKIIGKIKVHSSLFSKRYNELGKRIANVLYCVPLIKATSSDQFQVKWFNEVNQDIRKSQNSIDKLQSLISPVNEIFAVTTMVFMMCFIAFSMSQGSQKDFSKFLVYFLLMRRSISSANGIGGMIASLAAVRGPLREILKIYNFRNAYLEKGGPLSFNQLQVGIRFESVCFKYREEVVLKDLSLFFEKGKTTAIVGRTGSGKSTIASLVMRFYELFQGSIKVDGIDLSRYDLDSWRKKIGFVFQESFVFDASIRMNLNYGLEKNASDEKIWDALKKAQLSERIQLLPNKLDSEIGEHGVQLSGGEKQRLCLARIILRDPDIIIFDEATSALDSKTEKMIEIFLSEWIKDKTVIVIAHRLATIKNADKIICLENGEVIEEGNFSDLLKLKGKFWTYWLNQNMLN